MDAHRLLRSLGATAIASLPIATHSPTASAQPTGPAAFCAAYPDAPACDAGLASCETCHETPPARNLLGREIEDNLLPGTPRPLDPDVFGAALPDALLAIEGLDSDGDGYINLDEWLAGSDAANPDSVPGGDLCAGDPDKSAWRYDVCAYDARFTFTRVMIDVCGASPAFDEIEQIAADADPRARIHETLDTCLKSDNWRGRDGVLWQIAHRKIRPLAALKAGAEEGDIPLGDYEDDYNLFAYTQIDGHDARELLTAGYHVERTDAPTTYVPYARTPAQDTAARGGGVAQLTEIDRRAGMLTTRWNFVLNTMFTPIPRTTAAAAYRAYLGLDIARMQGLQDGAASPADYDNKGVAATECAVCHSTLDPLTYPFSRYVGLGGGAPGDYKANRMLTYVDTEGPGIADTPEAGAIFGQPVGDLVEWAAVAADSDAFAQATVMDYWMRFVGESPRDADVADFTMLWTDFADVHGHAVDAMLHDLIDTEAYSVP